jgi:hypothetical protein
VTPIFQQSIWLVRWPDIDAWTRRRLYREFTLSRSYIEAEFSDGLKNWLERGLSCILLLAVEKKFVVWHGCQSKNCMDAGKRSACPNHPKTNKYSEFPLAFHSQICIIRAQPSYAHFGKVDESYDSKGSRY